MLLCVRPAPPSDRVADVHANVGSWQELSRRTVFEKYGRAVECVDFALPSGGNQSYYVRTGSPTVCVVALTTDGKIALARQFRPGPKLVLYELPGGFVGSAESVESAATRELLEETGLSGRVQKVATYLDDAYSAIMRHCFVATGCRSTRAPNPDSSEFITTELVSVLSFRELLRSGQMTDVQAGYMGLDYLGLL